ncbi:hypothetical protein [Nocardia asteroides]|uniref:hypothetical protein n=1 Tax=Nocardia asteroides TaxID=1824 RepID=UPI0033ECB160
MIEPLIPPQTALQARIHGPLPTCVIPGTADPNLAYGVAVIGDAGRVADRAVLSTLNWIPGTRLTTSCTEGGLVLVYAAIEGPVRVTGAGFFRVPYRGRRRVRLLEGDRATGSALIRGSMRSAVGAHRCCRRVLPSASRMRRCKRCWWVRSIARCRVGPVGR